MFSLSSNRASCLLTNRLSARRLQISKAQGKPVDCQRRRRTWTRHPNPWAADRLGWNAYDPEGVLRYLEHTGPVNQRTQRLSCCGTNVSGLDSHWSGSHGIWLRGCPLRPVSRSVAGEPIHLPSASFSFWFGTGLIVLGVVVHVFSARSHMRLINQLERGDPPSHRPSTLAVAGILAVLGLALAIYLISVRDPIQAHPVGRQEKSMTAKPDTAIAPSAWNCRPRSSCAWHSWPILFR